MPAWGVSTVVLLFAAKTIRDPSPAAPAPVLFFENVATSCIAFVVASDTAHFAAGAVPTRLNVVTPALFVVDPK